MSEELIFAMSTKGEMKVEEFYSLLNYVSVGGIDEEEATGVDLRQEVIRFLDGLGYCEFDFKTRRVFMCPPSLVRLPGAGLPKVLLVGARIPKLVHALKEAVKREEGKALFLSLPVRPMGVEIPPLICIEADSKETLKRISNSCSIKCDVDLSASWQLCNLSDSIDDIKGKLAFMNRKWAAQPLKEFDVEKLRFVTAKEETEHCLTYTISPNTNQYIHWFWKRSEAAEIGRDWGRYLALAHHGRRVILYNRHHRMLAVPARVPLPFLLARAAALCTGVPPAIATTGKKGIVDIPPRYPLTIYSGVAPDVANIISRKLKQDAGYYDLESISKSDDE